MATWYASLYTGLFARFGPVPGRAHDPQVSVVSGTLGASGPQELTASGAGWDEAGAEGACVGEAVERWQAYPLPDDQRLESSFDAWPLSERAVEPERWVLFHPEQYTLPQFPFRPLTRSTVCPWVCFRESGTGRPCWVPEELAYLSLRPGERHTFCPGLSTGLASGLATCAACAQVAQAARDGDPVLLRGLQEVIERDAVVGGWWGRYPIEEWPLSVVLELLGGEWAARVVRPNLLYRCYRVDSPFSSHVTMVTLEGQDREGYCFSIGSACRESRAASWDKSLLEAVHGRQYVRHLKQSQGEQRPSRIPTSFPEHASYYSFHPDELSRTVLHAPSPRKEEGATSREDLAALVGRLGPERPVLFRSMTPPALAQEGLDWLVLRVLVPGLQPLHGDHRLPQLGGPLWAPRRLADWGAVPPHPFP
ncbi:MAG: YcaO-like family protein [Gemmataceae bacterium]|nr:YcaO-like family protein [Gemmataceae bacterium]